ncbi:alpha/beta fold hydrolase [Paenibacillus sacheonensis]|uniref:Alpha/beta fold hydrolase n=1 Tax=Paenibacillus sacheonensis TaxID=742054 RepID=A0A7X4YUK7_9BACL|nr:alpha/beta hydrolase [Paenibacillus sacheonensis]MBM7568142.1 pimeloyl-ACP methyl ester carboxylesterase [Paenibacillus sacheonensis]NBC71856.1 alpha/beta fold hydrolase [Paenibacillus sacheonensis]
MNIEKAYATGYIVSTDGTKIGYRQLGRGPSLVLMHGGLQASQSLMLLATAMSDEYTVYVPDRRGRGLSGPLGENYSIRRECEDLGALLDKTGAQDVFGLSSGALITLHSALHLPSIRKIALYEPPLSITPVLNKFMPRYEREIAEGKIVSAFITIIKGLGISPLLNLMPRFIMLPFLKLATRYGKEPEGDVPLHELIPTFQDDDFLIRETAETFQTFENVSAKSLIMGGSKSPDYFKVIIGKLAAIMPGARSMEFAGLDHSGPDDGGKPAIVAEELRRFFRA